jgi:hypothetical protein
MQTAHSAIVEAQETPPADINACHTAKTCVHEYYKSWAGKNVRAAVLRRSLRICQIPGSPRAGESRRLTRRGVPHPSRDERFDRPLRITG